MSTTFAFPPPPPPTRRPHTANRSSRRHMKKRRLSIQAIFNNAIAFEPPPVNANVKDKETNSKKFKTLPRSFVAPTFDADTFLLDDDPFADLTHGPPQPPPPLPPLESSVDAPTQGPTSPLAEHAVPLPAPVLARAVSHAYTTPANTTPAHHKPAFKPRPSLPSLHTLAQMSVVVPHKVRRGRVGAGLPFEPWDLDTDAFTASPASASSAEPMPPMPALNTSDTTSTPIPVQKHDPVELSTTPTPESQLATTPTVTSPLSPSPPASASVPIPIPTKHDSISNPPNATAAATAPDLSTTPTPAGQSQLSTTPTPANINGDAQPQVCLLVTHRFEFNLIYDLFLDTRRPRRRARRPPRRRLPSIRLRLLRPCRRTRHPRARACCRRLRPTFRTTTPPPPRTSTPLQTRRRRKTTTTPTTRMRTRTSPRGLRVSSLTRRLTLTTLRMPMLKRRRRR
ncbi:hypothetical protein K438DRAFT_861623 [Mycena galopus ATCC 62051]|nr:hypothetical protein K438DRAFT_861623 [Mycena galopus ATCC 62051]